MGAENPNYCPLGYTGAISHLGHPVCSARGTQFGFHSCRSFCRAVLTFEACVAPSTLCPLRSACIPGKRSCSLLLYLRRCMAQRSRYEQKCKDCGSSEFVDDRAAGDLICQVCGLVAESHVIDESSEWRTFAESDKPQADRTRVGGATDTLLSEGGIGATVITASTKEGGNTAARNLTRLQTRNNTDKALQQGYSEINKNANRLKLNQSIQDTAHHYYKLVYEQKGARGRGIAAVSAAVLFCACRQEGMPRTFKEIEAAVPEATKKDIGRAFKTIVAVLQAEEGAVAVAPRRAAVSDYMRRFCSQLDIKRRDVNACTEVADNAVPREGTTRRNSPWDGKSPISIAAAIIYMVTQLPQSASKPSTIDIAQICNVAEGTLQSTYRDLYTERASLIPSWFAKPEDLHTLQQPRDRQVRNVM